MRGCGTYGRAGHRPENSGPSWLVSVYKRCENHSGRPPSLFIVLAVIITILLITIVTYSYPHHHCQANSGLRQASRSSSSLSTQCSGCHSDHAVRDLPFFPPRGCHHARTDFHEVQDEAVVLVPDSLQVSLLAFFSASFCLLTFSRALRCKTGQAFTPCPTTLQYSQVL